ncbi:hypothetical protein BDV24DRAFT_122247 [Aspergillus arachidicola]|uniref:Uncharacterized protein n=1 Tax=Aspergillus arachidicola TaxID=656916 RepID=A0A2G7FIM8_9EURO|nr:hypothetical protein BDV24DRAFT_122247 [Aspergillus arachidicola]PIG80464.1 hypothetical protein AARAC_001669 [Aspergillus arachidicola]
MAPQSLPKSGWSNSPVHLDYFWSTDDSPGRLTAQNYGIDSAVGVMCTKPGSAGPLHMFASGQTYYLWNPIDDQVSKIISPIDLESIVQAIDVGGLQSLKIEEL